MPQYGRPNADTTKGNFLNEASLSASMFASIDESVASDADYILSPASPASEVCAFKLSAITDPVSSTGHIMRMRSAVNLASQETLEFTQQLRQSYSSEAALGTLIASQTRASVSSTGFVESSYSMVVAEVDSITDYSNLSYRFIVNKP